MENRAIHLHQGDTPPFEMWENPVTGSVAAFINFPVGENGRIPTTVIHYGVDHLGRRCEWEINYQPAVRTNSDSTTVGVNKPKDESLEVELSILRLMRLLIVIGLGLVLWLFLFLLG